uniref:Killer protein TOXINS, BIOFILMS, CELL METABOLISM.25A n=1 Tax=Podoviridae sp. cttxo15 TaxID=2826584 RepID=A0A8S5N1Z7_9CAUD|nr:MAG TPA: Killer protein TOXINS, BIOFILMS, CELL METABOLISM.25A [Podoviridae sp. cttxo15]
MRLNDQRRLIFTVNQDGEIQVIEILEISKHYE